MPLHLLGKKSWNVYNPENIARVRRDEGQAKAREEEEERRMQEIDAERRIQILRGGRPSTPPPPPSAPSDTRRDRPHGEDAGRYRKRRRLAGENDTDRDIRLAREDAELMLAKREELAVSKTSDAPLLDSTGHINLFPSEAAQKPAEKNREAEKEAADKNRSYEDQYTMRFSNAAGYRQSAGQRPWYSSSSHDALAPDAMPEKDVWGNEDPMRQERERARVDANDPLAAIKRGVRQLKSVELERKKWNQERKRELDALKAAEKQRSRHRRRRSTSRSKASESGDSLENFSLDAPDKHQDKKSRSSHRHRSHHREKSRGRSPDRSRKRHSHSHSHRDHRDHHRGDVREAQSSRRHA
ncbi:hypothetical protein CNMCM5793_006486 [Aspergillus hiratsukae]|uniref:CBF1-interacting co-repressor CIR N-terminal domain-containing protein n=1 Tax=Aspergillus hiratsukae TaxID=1194566 RepID=A0A8H6PH34_9EURO|nr:hypothetical protein CNMCM5793_006486 [Aspergillus hiratsukae]KAF7156597.1 hypothetical protein CNMCM6106_000887 [Aspergillus hiratsukae]